MKRGILILLLAVIGMGVWTTRSKGQQADKEKVRLFMRAKLEHSQKALEGLVTGDFDMIAKNSQDMSLLSLAASWQVLQTPEYVERSAEFRRSVDSMTEAARNKNLDGASLAYVDVTLKCVNCHNYVRKVRMAGAERLLK